MSSFTNSRSRKKFVRSFAFASEQRRRRTVSQNENSTFPFCCTHLGGIMDLLLNDTGDGGELTLVGGDIQGDGTLFTAVYISLFGGDCFSNVFEKYESNGDFEAALNQTITLKNLKNVENKAQEALKWLIDEGYGNNIKPILEDIRSINLGAVYENVVAQELKAHGFSLYYYDNKKTGEVDYLIDDTRDLTTIPLEVKSGKDYKQHSALDKFLQTPEYNIKRAYVLSNERQVTEENGITYIPIYYIMFFHHDLQLSKEELIF